MSGMKVRQEKEDDVEAIAEVTIEAFKDLDISSHTEHFIVAALRESRALAVSLVAEVEGEVVGHIAFSPISTDTDVESWFALGPVSVLPDCQRQGIGTALIEEGLATLRAQGAKGCCLVGHPDYYRRFGFVNPPSMTSAGVPEEVFFAMSFDGEMPTGAVNFHPAFSATG